MKRLKFLGLTLLVFVYGLVGCSTQTDNEPDPADRTYPQAYDFKTVTIKQLKTEIAAPDSVNVKAYVVGRIYCPPDVMCTTVIGDHLMIAETLNNDGNVLSLSVTSPLQFKKKHLYTFSLKVKKGNDEGEKYFNLMGYSE